MEEKSYTSTHPLGHTGPVTGSLYLHFLVPPYLPATIPKRRYNYTVFILLSCVLYYYLIISSVSRQRFGYYTYFLCWIYSLLGGTEASE